MPPDDTTETHGLDVVDGLVQLSFAVQAILGRAAARHELSVTQLRLLGILRDRTPAMLELAAFLELEKSSVSGLVDRAEQRGLVTRTPGAHDRRAVHVALTRHGRALAQRVAGEVAAEITTLTAPLRASERDWLAAIATTLLQPAT